MSSSFNPARRQLFKGDLGARRQPQRPPWSVAEIAFTDGCTRCGDCIKACPTQIIHAGSGGYPELDFQLGECTFCGDCAGACPEPLFRSREASPWTIRAQVGAACVTLRNVECRRCEEACEPGAIRFTPRLGRAAEPQVQLETCTGCGACLSVCPTQAISMQRPERGV
ncbi:ferredoxin-type protein NapF [Motiliproteus sp. SC1-56]|uniref:ferredoxin-type protein NapF n=1 Tax=Motiliproteus sp. SC1-56 TaxID=2799565 RepID=UPI001A8D11EE|nr:ferredoxin-type protein NapF [Motiliproteus sp. SC1-56]